jgi:uncharacterized protein (TIGR03437 family)
MKLTIVAISLFSASFLSPPASASVATFGNSAQNVVFTGLGGNFQGEGQSRVTWGSCVYDGANTKCTVSAPFTGVGSGGTITFLFTYPGNGPAPMTATSIAPGNDLVTLSLTAGSFQVSLALNSGATVAFYQIPNWSMTFSNATCTGLAICTVGQVGLTQNATLTGPVTGMYDATPVIRTSQGVISASAYGAFSALAPGTWMEIYGTNLANVVSQSWAASDFKGNLAPTSVGGTTVTIGGQSAFIDYVSPGQVNAQVPSGIASGTQPVVVTTAGGSSVAFNITVNATEPGLLAPGSFKMPAGQYVAALFPDAVTFVLPPGTIAGLPSTRAKPGDTLTIYGVGFGNVTPNSPAGQIVTQANQLASTVQVAFAGTPANVTFSGLTGGYLGLYQIDVVVPNVAAGDAVPVTFFLNGVATPQTLIIAIQN